MYCPCIDLNYEKDYIARNSIMFGLIFMYNERYLQIDRLDSMKKDGIIARSTRCHDNHRGADSIL